MFNYVYMKILESQPDRYDWGLKWLSLGQAPAITRRIVNEYVTGPCRVLDMGCGTGTLALLAAQKGAKVTGFDISVGMLAVARKKVYAAGVAERVELDEAGVAGMRKFGDACFDLVTATLLFSELSREEQRFALIQACRVLKFNGHLIITDEVVPANICKRVLYTAVRLPVMFVTFALTQTTTKGVTGLEQLVSEAGFRICNVEHSRLDSFLYLHAIKEHE